MALPTDTIYGVACLAQDSRAVRAVYSLKGRDGTKPLAICLAGVEHVYRCAAPPRPRGRCAVLGRAEARRGGLSVTRNLESTCWVGEEPPPGPLPLSSALGCEQHRAKADVTLPPAGGRAAP